MGYEIIYQRAFLRTNTGIIPMVLAGSNNCYDFYWDRAGRQRQKRARSWCSIYSRLTNLPENEFRQWLHDNASDAERELFMYRSKWICGNQEYAWFDAGIKNARTLEEYALWNPGLSIYCYLYVSRRDPGDTEKRKYSNEMGTYCKTTEELEQWLSLAEIRKTVLQTEEPDARCSQHIMFTAEDELRIVPKMEGPVVVMYYKGSYVAQYETGKFLSFTSEPEKAAVFQNADEAARLIGIGTLKNAGHPKFLRVDTVKNAAQRKQFLLYISGGTMAGRYPTKRSRTAVYSTFCKDHAKQFNNRSEAIRWARRYREKLDPGKITSMQLIDLSSEAKENIM